MAIKVALPPSEALYPAPVVLVSCVDLKTRAPNIITIAWCGVVCSKPPLLSISVRPSRHSHRLLQETGDFCVNIPPVSLVAQSDACGCTSGAAVDKFAAHSFTALPATKISSPLISECPVNIECRLVSTHRLGAHDMFIGEVVAVHADKDVMTAANRIDFSKAAPFVYNHGEYWSLGERIGSYGFSNA